MRIFTKVKFVFFKPGGNIDQFEATKPLGFHDVPDWVKKDPQFKRGVASGEIEVIENRAQQLKAEAKLAGVNLGEEEAPKPKGRPKATETK